MSAKNTGFYKVGELIHAENPFAHVLICSRSKEFCDYCLKKNTSVKTCAICKYVRYCDQLCQKAAWKDHKRECKCLLKFRKNIHVGDSRRDMIRLIGKVFFKLKAKGQDYYETVGTYKRSYKDLISHADDWNKTGGLTMFSHAVVEYMGIENMVFIPDAMEAFGKMKTNAFNTGSNHDRLYGSGLYLGASMFDHSCIPNAVVSFHGERIEIRAIKPIPKGDMKKVTISYTTIIGDGGERKETIDGFFGKCYCSDCSLPYGESVLTKIIDKEKAKEVIDLSERVLDQLDKLGDADNNMIEADTAMIDYCLKKQEGVLGDTNLLCLRMLDRRAFLDVNYDARKKYGQKLLTKIKSVFGDASGEVNVVLEMLVCAYARTNDLKNAVKYKSQLFELYQIQGRPLDLTRSN